jgi:hypothetical protein
MKKITLAVLLMASLCAHAETFQNIQLKADTCFELGDYAAQFYELRARGEPKPVFDDSGTHMNMIFLYAGEYAWGEATDANDARLHVRAKCMDNYDTAAANDRNGVARPEKLN